MRYPREIQQFSIKVAKAACSALASLCAFAQPSHAARPGANIQIVEDYGAKCDGVTDDATAVQSAIDANPGLKIVFPAGVCALGSSLKIVAPNTALEGQGSGTTVLLFTHAPSRDSGNVTFTAANPSVGYEKSYIRGAVRHLTISNGAKGATSGAGLQVVQANGFHVEDVYVYDAFIGMDFVGGSNVHVTDAHVGTGGGWTSVVPGSRCMRFREQRLAAGGSMPASNMYIVNTDCGGIGAHTDNGIEIGGADTLLFSNIYVCCVANDDVYIAVDDKNDGAYVAAVTFNGGYLDGSPEGQTGLHIPLQASDTRDSYRGITLNGTFVANFRKYGVRLEAPKLHRFSATGAQFGANAASSIFIEAVGSATITGDSFRGGSGAAINLMGPRAIGESLAVVGNVWDTAAPGDTHGHALEETGEGDVTGSISVVGNAFGGYLEPVSWQGALPPTYRYVGNSGAHVGPDALGALTLNGGLAIPVTTIDGDARLSSGQSVVLVKGKNSLRITLPSPTEHKGLAYTIKNLTPTPQRISAYVDASGNLVETLPLGTTLRLISDGKAWQQI